MPSSFSRRRFLASVAAATAPAWLLEESRSYAQSAAPQSPNDKPHIALIGCGGQGRGDTRNAANFGTVVAVCDVDDRHAGQAAGMFPGAKTYKDFRKLLEAKDIDVVINGTPDHWHTLVNLAALKAGKDVYSEKPLTLTIDEGKRLVKAVRESKRILQTGSQQRSDAKFRQACELVRNGRIGKLTHVTTILPSGLHDGPFASKPVPAGLDWDVWQGQTPAVEYVPQRCHFSFRYWYDYSGGTMTDWGAHHNDIALWGMGLDRSGPVAIEGRPLVEPIPGGYTAASQYEVTYTYANGVTHRCASTTLNGPTGSVQKEPKPGDPPHGVTFEGTEGKIFVTRGKIEASRPEILSEPLTSKKVELYVSTNHMGNFFDCVRSRRPPICDAEIGHRSVSVCHLGVIAIRLGRKLTWDPDKEKFVNDKEADGYVARPQRKPWTYEMV
jgi:myo-inositol 2-dehydrogenase / D-chiro-inositol 1-dehydrogenase